MVQIMGIILLIIGLFNAFYIAKGKIIFSKSEKSCNFAFDNERKLMSMEATMVFDYDPNNVTAQKVLAFIRSLGIFHERSLDLDEAINDVKTGNVEDYDNVDDFFKQHNLSCETSIL